VVRDRGLKEAPGSPRRDLYSRNTSQHPFVTIERVGFECRWPRDSVENSWAAGPPTNASYRSDRNGLLPLVATPCQKLNDVSGTEVIFQPILAL
jgi:hypothetical protein